MQQRRLAVRLESSMGTFSCSPSVAATARKKFPSKARAMPTEQIMMYFHVASRERRCRWK